jgi:energy-coupling factor transporter ATP-binding protein EcfA2
MVNLGVPEQVGVSMNVEHRNQVLALEGPNFSGRTSLLKRAVMQETSAIYLGPEISNYLSGICTSVTEEIALYARHRARTEEVLTALRLHGLAGRNPFTLSGGEQVLTLIAGAVAAQPLCVALDTVLEQLDQAHRENVLRVVSRVTRVLIADNRIAEFRDHVDGSERVFVQDRSGHVAEPIAKLQSNLLPAFGASPCVLELDNLRFDYHSQFPILRGVRAVFKPGQIYVLQGPNGAGKSTLARILVGVLRSGSGRLLRDGQCFDPYRHPAQTVAYHFQHPDAQLFSRTVATEVAAGLPVCRDATTHLKAVLCSFGLGAIAGQSPLDLPFAARKRVALAATFAMERSWTILDEPTLAQDDETVAELACMLKAWAKRGAGIIVITHSSQFAKELDASVMQLEEGLLT